MANDASGLRASRPAQAEKHEELLTSDECERVGAVVAKHGEHGAAELLRVARVTLLRGLARRPLRASTATCIRARLRELSGATT